MGEFDFWQMRDLELDDRSFADALLTLGVISTAAFLQDAVKFWNCEIKFCVLCNKVLRAPCEKDSF